MPLTLCRNPAFLVLYGTLGKVATLTLICKILLRRTFGKTTKTPSKGFKRKKRQSKVKPDENVGGQETVCLPTAVAFKSWILDALREFHGELGSVIHPVDVLSWEPTSGEGRLRIPSRSLVPVRAALTLAGSCRDTPCAVSVTEVSPFLAGLACERSL